MKCLDSMSSYNKPVHPLHNNHVECYCYYFHTSLSCLCARNKKKKQRKLIMSDTRKIVASTDCYISLIHSRKDNVNGRIEPLLPQYCWSGHYDCVILPSETGISKRKRNPVVRIVYYEEIHILLKRWFMHFYNTFI